MSFNAGFSTLSFPALRDVNRDATHDQGDERSRARGHSAGYAAGLRSAAAEMAATAARLGAEHAAAVRHGQAQVDRALAVLGAAAAALDERTVPVLRDAENTLVSTALDLAEAIIGHELDDAETSARSALGRALDHTNTVQPHSVRLNPDDLAMLDATVLAKAGVDFAADPSLARGDAVTEFPDGYLDARIGTALARAKAVLLGGTE
jgi:flagellar assembly protein FliH